MGRVISVLFALIFICLSSSIRVSAYAPLGSEPVERCEIHSYECPSHYICVTFNNDDFGRCFCDRFYGFYGPTCEKLSVASYLTLVICCVAILLTSRTLYLNLEFGYKLHRTGSLKRNTLCRCLFFNTMLVIPTMGLAIGIFGGLTSIDKQMIWHQYIRYPVYTIMILAFVLSTMSISLAWIETVEKTRRRGRHSHWKYKLLLYGSSAFAVLISVISFRYSQTDMVGVFEGITVSFSYFQAKHMVTEALSVMEENGDIVVYQGASDVLHTIKRTSKTMMTYSLLISFSFLVTAFTVTSSRPKYKEQNHLPRYVQGQVCFFMALLSFYKINTTLLEYLKSSAKRQLARTPIDRSYFQSMKAFCSCLCWWCGCCDDHMDMEIHQHFELADMGDRQAYVDADENQEALSVIEESSEKYSSSNKSSEKKSSGKSTDGRRSSEKSKQQLEIERSSSSMQQFALSDSTALRRLLSSLFSPSEEAASNSADSHMPSLTPFALVTVDLDDYQSQARLVADTGGGRLADFVLKPEDAVNGASSGSSDSCQLVAGSHAFVKCYGEPFIRCCLDSFRFGFAVGHESLTRHSGVLLAGEIEVNEAGIATRWLNKSGLHIPPQWVLSQSGLPFELAWLYLSEHEVSTIELHRRDALQSSGALVNLLADSTDDTEDQSSEDCRCASCARIRHGAADSTVNQPKDQPDVKTEDRVYAAGSLVVCERRKRFRGLGTVGSDGQSSISCSWVLKASADIGNSWQLPMGTFAYVRTKEAVARVRHMMGGSRVEQSHTVVPSDMLYDSSSSPISELTEFSDAEQLVGGMHLYKTRSGETLGTPVVNRGREEVELNLNEAVGSDVSSVTMPVDVVQHQGLHSSFIGKNSGEAVESENQAIVLGGDMADEDPGYAKSDVSLGSKASFRSCMTPEMPPPVFTCATLPISHSGVIGYSAIMMDTPTAYRERNAMHCYEDESSSSSDISSITMSFTSSSQQDMNVSSASRVTGGGVVEELNHEANVSLVPIIGASLPNSHPSSMMTAPPQMLSTASSHHIDCSPNNSSMADADTSSSHSSTSSLQSSQSTMSAVLAPSRNPQSFSTWPSRIITQAQSQNRSIGSSGSIDTVDVSEDTACSLTGFDE